MPSRTKLTLPDSGAGSADWWKGQLDWAAEIRKKKLPDWRTNALAYQDKLTPPIPGGIRVNIEFEKTEQKKHQLFFQVPALKLKPTPRTIRESMTLDPTTRQPALDPRTGQPMLARDLKKAIAILQEVLTYWLGPKGANTKALMDELIFDVLCPSGIGFAKIGYERYTSGTVPMQVGTQPDPNFQQPGAVLGVAGVAAVPPMVPVYEPAPNIVSEKYYASRISPARGLVPPEFMLSDYAKAEWLAHDFFITPEVAKKNGWDTDGATILAHDRNAVDEDDRICKLEDGGRRTGQIQCRETFFYPEKLGFHDNPDMIHRLVYLGGQKDPVVYEAFRDQKFDERGRWVRGLKTLPIKVFTLRYVSDCALPPSDCAVTRSASNELAEFRTQQMKHLRKAVPRVAVDVSRFMNDDIKQKFINGKHYDDIPVDGNPQNVSAPIGQPQMPIENGRSEQELKGDIDRAWALPRDSAAEPGNTTATEVATIARATATRLAGETNVTLRFFLALAEGVGSLIQLYADREDYVEIAGEQGATQIEAWDKDTVAGEFLYDLVPDSSKPSDAKGDQDLALNRHNLIANSPFVNGKEEMRQLIEAFGGDPAPLVQDPPAPPPEKPKINLAVNGKDLDPASPQYQNVVNVLIAAGIPAQQLEQPSTPDEPIKPAPVIDRERLRMAEADAADHRAGGLVGMAR